MNEENKMQESTNERFVGEVKGKPELDEAVMNEVMVPTLSQEEFTIAGKTIKVMPLKVKHQIEFAQIVSKAANDVAFQLDTGSWCGAVTSSLNNTEVLPKLIEVMAKNAGVELSYDDILDQSEVGFTEMTSIVTQLAAKNEAVGKPVLDFFTKVWPVVQAELKKNLPVLAEKITQGGLSTLLKS